MSKEPTEVADPLSPARSTPSRRSPRLAQPSQPGGLAGSPSPVDRRSIPATIITAGKKLFPLVKRFWTWQMSHLGGGRSQEMAHRSTMEVQAFFRHFGDFRVSLLSSQNFDVFVTKLEKDGKKPGSILFNIRSLMKFLDFLMTKSIITVGRHINLRKLLVNIQNSLERKGRIQRATAAQEQFHERLPPQVRSAYFSSDYVREYKTFLKST